MSHSHGPRVPLDSGRAATRRRLRWALVLALAVLGLEIVGAIVSNSLALAADAGHVLGDALAVGLALAALWLAGREGSARRTFGWHRAEIMAAWLNGSALLVVAGVLIWRALERIGDDPEVRGAALLGFALVGLLANLGSAALLRRDQRQNLNVRGAYYHVLGDALGSLAALLAGLVILTTGWVAIDLIASIAIAALIILGALRLLVETADVLLEAAPPGLDVTSVEAEVLTLPGVRGVHDLHLWTVTSGFPSLSAHLEIQEGLDPFQILLPVAERLRERFGLEHVTLQPETARLHAAMACCRFPDSPREVRPASHDDPLAPPGADWDFPP